MAEQSIEVRSGGHVVLPDGRGIPGSYANCLLVYDDETAQPVRIEPFPIVFPEPEQSGQQDDSNTGEAQTSAQGQESEVQS